MRRGGRAELSPAQQFLFLRNNLICAGAGTLNHKGLVWNYRSRPTLLSREYGIRIVFERDDVPKIFVKDPDLKQLAGGRDLPHVYRRPTRLCLYLPGSGEWLRHMRIDQTFVPWTATWLYYFEEWLASDEWKGGGEHPAGEEDVAAHRRNVVRDQQ